MQDPPSVRLPGHPATAGGLIAWRKNEDGSKEYLVEWVPNIAGPRGGLAEPVQEWFTADQVEQIPGQDYTRVPRTRATG